MRAVANAGKIIKYIKNGIRIQNYHDPLQKWPEIYKSKFNTKIGVMSH